MNEDFIEELTEEEIEEYNIRQDKLKRKYGLNNYQLIKCKSMVCPYCEKSIDWLPKENICLNCHQDITDYLKNVKKYLNKINMIYNNYKRRCKL